MSEEGSEVQDVGTIIASILQQRADQRQIALGSRKVVVSEDQKNNFKVSRRQIVIRTSFVLAAADPVAQLDPILDAVVNFEVIPYRRKAERIVLGKSVILGWAAYLQKNMSQGEYDQFIQSLLPPPPHTNGHTKQTPEELEGEHFIDLGLPFQP
ncbi:MAG: hypothetical protein AB7V18_19380 [Pyrinomonadaceae bacterium]